MNKHSGRLSLYLVLIVALIAGYFYLNNQVATQSDYTMGQLEQAVRIMDHVLRFLCIRQEA